MNYPKTLKLGMVYNHPFYFLLSFADSYRCYQNRISPWEKFRDVVEFRLYFDREFYRDLREFYRDYVDVFPRSWGILTLNT